MSDRNEYLARWRAANRDKTRAAQKRYYDSHSEILNAKTREWWEQNPGKSAEYMRRRRAAMTEAEIDAYRARRRELYDPDKMRQWRAENPDRARESARRWVQANREKASAKSSRWAARNPDKVKARTQLRRARKKAATVYPITAVQIEAKMAYWGNKCWMCDGPFEHVDHVKPLSKGGPHMLANLRPACASCNASKNNRWPL